MPRPESVPAPTGLLAAPPPRVLGGAGAHSSGRGRGAARLSSRRLSSVLLLQKRWDLVPGRGVRKGLTDLKGLESRDVCCVHDSISASTLCSTATRGRRLSLRHGDVS